jgi:hypothetical protein
MSEGNLAAAGLSSEGAEMLGKLRSYLVAICPAMLFEEPVGPTFLEDVLSTTEALDCLSKFVSSSEHSSLLLDRSDDTGSSPAHHSALSVLVPMSISEAL